MSEKGMQVASCGCHRNLSADPICALLLVLSHGSSARIRSGRYRQIRMNLVARIEHSWQPYVFHQDLYYCCSILSLSTQPCPTPTPTPLQAQMLPLLLPLNTTPNHTTFKINPHAHRNQLESKYPIPTPVSLQKKMKSKDEKFGITL